MTRPLRVLYAISTLERCGPVHQLAQIVAHLDRDEFDPVIITLSPEPDRSLLPWFVERAIPVRCLNTTRTRWVIKGKKKLRNAIREHRADVLHTHGLRADVAAAGGVGDIPHCSTVHNYPLDDYPRAYGIVAGNFMSRRHVQAFRAIAAPVAVSESISRQFAQAQGLSMRVIPNGIDTEAFTPCSPQRKSDLRTARGFSEADRVIVFAGPLIPRKDPLAILEAFSLLGNDTARLVMLGDGPLRENCERCAPAGATIAGHCDDVTEWLQASDVFVSASHSEGLPMAVLEALACGLPTLLSDIAPHAEILSSRDAGLLYQRGDTTAFSSSMRRILDSDIAAMGNLARGLAVDRYSAARMSSAYQHLYRELARNSVR